VRSRGWYDKSDVQSSMRRIQPGQG